MHLRVALANSSTANEYYPHLNMIIGMRVFNL